LIGTLIYFRKIKEKLKYKVHLQNIMTGTVNVSPQIEQIYLSITAYDAMMGFALENKTHEVIGIFFGNIVNEDSTKVIVKSAVPMRVGGHVYAEFIDTDYEIMGAAIKKHEEKGESLIGWFHSHPFGNKNSIYMSSTDRFFHTNAMQVYQTWIALVLDPFRIKDPTTFRGIKAFIIKQQRKIGFNVKKVFEIPILFESKS
jgi:proteasome lid subunit RPN8/RPN11